MSASPDAPDRPCHSALAFEFASRFDPARRAATRAETGGVLILAPRGEAADWVVGGALAHRLQNEGVACHFALCDNLPICSRRSRGRDTRALCDDCIAQNVDFLSFNGFSYESIWESLEPDDLREAQRVAARTTAANLAELQVEGIALGAGQCAALRQHLSRLAPAGDPDADAAAERLAYAAVLLCRSLRRILERRRPERILLGDGRSTWSQIGLALARELGIRAVCHGESDAPTAAAAVGALRFATDCAIDAPGSSGAGDPMREEAPDAEEATALDAYLAQRTAGAPLGAALRSRTRGRRTLALLVDAERDAACAGAPGIFDSALDWIATTIEAIGDTPIELLIRIDAPPPTGPASSGWDVEAEIRTRIGPLPRNVHLLPRAPRVALAELIEAAESVLVYASRDGLGCAVRGACVVVCGAPEYRDLGLTLDPQGHEPYRAGLVRPGGFVAPRGSAERARRHAVRRWIRQSFPRPALRSGTEGQGSHVRVADDAALASGADPYLDRVVGALRGPCEFTAPRGQGYLGLLPSLRASQGSAFATAADALLRLREWTHAKTPEPTLSDDTSWVRAQLAPCEEDGTAHAAQATAALAQAQRGQIDVAIEALEGALRRSPGCAPALEALARIYLDCDRADAAVPLLRRVLHTQPEREAARQLRVDAERMLGDPAAAARETQAWIDAVPGSKRALSQGAALVLEHGAAASLRPLLEQIDRLGGDPAASRWLRAMGFTPRADAAPQPIARVVRPEAPEISVLLCSLDRAGQLRRCLRALQRQTLARERFEVVLVNDGSSDATGQVMREALNQLPGVYCEHPSRRALAAARNTALRAARGRTVLFINDDTYPEPDLLEQHLRAHAEHRGAPVAVLGHIRFHPEHERRVLSQALHQADLLFPVTGSKPGVEYGFDHFVTGNLSAPRRLFDDGEIGFDESFTCYGCEDIEVGYRLFQQGLRVCFQPGARVLHDHRLTLRDFERRQRQIATNLAVYLGKHPELVPHYLGVARLDRALLDRWRAEAERMAPGIADLMTQIEEIQDVELAPEGEGDIDEIGRTHSLVQTVAAGLRNLSAYCHKQGLPEVLDERPDLRARLTQSSEARPHA